MKILPIGHNLLINTTKSLAFRDTNSESQTSVLNNSLSIINGLKFSSAFCGNINGSNIIPLDRNSESALFFGVNTPESIQIALGNHMVLSLMKSREQNLVKEFGNVNLEDEVSVNNKQMEIWYKKDSTIEELRSKGAARFTFYSRDFNPSGELSAHTIGLVVDKKNNALLVLDSLPFDEPKVVKYRNLLLDKLFRQPWHKENFSKIIFSTKPQQKMTEYTCNNWTHANIEAVQKALDSGTSFVNSSELNEVLPNDINQILRKQKEYVISKKDELWATL